jgi:hypothetical protein
MGAAVIRGLDLRGEQPVHLDEIRDLPGGDLDEELVTHGAEEPFDLASALGASRSGMDQADAQHGVRPQPRSRDERGAVVDVDRPGHAPRTKPVTQGCFETDSVFAARGFMIDSGANEVDADRVQAAIALHLDLSSAETVIDMRSGQSIGRIDLGGEAGNTASDARAGHILVDVQTRSQIAVIDPATDQIIDQLDVTGCDTNHGLYIDADHRLAFVACEGNAKLLVVDLDTKKTTAPFDVGQSPDVLAFDQGLHRIYVAAESGTVSIFDETADGKTINKVAEDKLASSVHTVAVDQATHRVFFALENVDGHPVLRVMQAVPASGEPATTG